MEEPIRRMKVEAEKREEDVGESASFSSEPIFVLPDNLRVDFLANSPPDSPVSTFDVIFEII